MSCTKEWIIKDKYEKGINTGSIIDKLLDIRGIKTEDEKEPEQKAGGIGSGSMLYLTLNITAPLFAY